MTKEIKKYDDRRKFQYINMTDEFKMMIRVLKETHFSKMYLELYEIYGIYSMTDLIDFLGKKYINYSFDSCIYTIGRRTFFYNDDLINKFRNNSLQKEMLFYNINSIIYRNIDLLDILNYATYEMQNNFFIKLYFKFKNKIKL